MLFNTPFLHNNLQRLIISLALFVCGVQYASASQDTRWYDVEVIIFKQSSKQYRESEVWPKDISLPDMVNTRPLTKNSSRNSYRMLRSGEMRLNSAAARIKAAPELEMLMHVGWRQPGLSKNRAVSVPIYDGMLEGANYRKPGSGKTPHRLEGTLKLVLSRYLHIYTDLLYREPSSSEAAAIADTSTPGYRYFQMQQGRRMRSNELHYLDHPVLGMVVRVTPYK